MTDLYRPIASGGRGTPPVVLLTGSQTWKDVQLVGDVLAVLRADLGPFTLRHGACPRGADDIAHWWGLRMAPLGVTLDPHPADWAAPCTPDCDHGPRPANRAGREYCPAAGTRRNTHMVGLGADLCVAFIDRCHRCRNQPLHGSHGSVHCSDAAEAAGITTLRWKQTQT